MARHAARGDTLRTAAACGFLALLPLGAAAQSGMNRAEAAQLYTAAGFRIVNDQPVNRCGRPAKPRVTFVDVNGDKRPEALFIDEDPCYASSGRYFSVLVKEGAAWRAVISGAGSVQALPSRTAGWMDMRVSDPSCVRDHRYGGRNYVAATDCAGRSLATAPQPAIPQAAKPTPPAPRAQPAPTAPTRKAAVAGLQPADEAALFKAAGFTRRGSAWRSGCDDPTASYTPGRIEQIADLNGDGLPEVVLSEGGTFCYGNTGQAFWVVSKLASGGWKLVTNGTGIPQFLETKGADGWPDISVGGPGFCFPVQRWNGKGYKLQRWEYEGKACKPPR
jgi:hypothetical protein